MNWVVFAQLLGMGGGGGVVSVDAYWEFAVASSPQLHFGVAAAPFHFAASDLQPIGFVAAASQIQFKSRTPPMHFVVTDRE